MSEFMKGVADGLRAAEEAEAQDRSSREQEAARQAQVYERNRELAWEIIAACREYGFPQIKLWERVLVAEEYVPAGLGESAYGGRVMLPETMRKTYEKQYIKDAWILFRHGGYGFISDDALALSEDGEYYIVSEAASAQVRDIGELPTDECAKIIDHPEPTRVEGLLESYARDAIVERVRNGYVPHFDRRPW